MVGLTTPECPRGTPRVLNEVRQKCGTKNPEGPLPRDLGPIAGAIDQHTSKVGLLNLAWYEA